MRGNAVKHETAQLSRGRLGQDLGQQIGKHLLGWHIGELDLPVVLLRGCIGEDRTKSK